MLGVSRFIGLAIALSTAVSALADEVKLIHEDGFEAKDAADNWFSTDKAKWLYKANIKIFEKGHFAELHRPVVWTVISAPKHFFLHHRHLGTRNPRLSTTTSKHQILGLISLGRVDRLNRRVRPPEDHERSRRIRRTRKSWNISHLLPLSPSSRQISENA